MRRIVYALLCLVGLGHATSIERHLARVEHGPQEAQIAKIDFIYLINLDHRPEKLGRMQEQFDGYGLTFFRFPAIYGWALPLETFDDLGVLFTKGMKEKQSGRQIAYNGQVLLDPRTTRDPETPGQFYFLNGSFYGKNCFSVSMKGGAIGCTLSHLSVLQDALDHGYETIWILEDDVVFLENPHHLACWIEKLDEVAGRNGWDVLYTDSLTYFKSREDIEWIWRPDVEIQYDRLTEVKLCGDFLKIGGRGNTHSMVIRRSGMEKILAFEKTHGMFVPYDMEISIVPNIRLFNLRANLTKQRDSGSDTVRKNFE